MVSSLKFRIRILNLGISLQSSAVMAIYGSELKICFPFHEIIYAVKWFYVLYIGENKYFQINSLEGLYCTLNEAVLIYLYLESNTGMMCNRYFTKHPDPFPAT